MTAILEPSVTFSIIPASQLAGVQDQHTLILGQMLAAGTATSGALETEIPDDNSWNALYGRTSHIAGMIRAFKRENNVSRLDAIGVADGAGTKGTATLAFTGTATENGTYLVSVGSKKDHEVEIDVLSGDAAVAVGLAITTAFGLDLDAPFVASDATGTSTFTAEDFGTLCNDWDIRISGTIAGLSVVVTGWTGGATDPTLTNIFDVIGEIRYQTIIWPSAWDVDEVETLLNARFNTTNQILDGVAIQTKKGTLAELKAYAVQNSQSLVIVGNKTVSETLRKGTMVPEMPDTMAAEMGAIRALRLTQDALLTQYLSTVASRDQYGGIAIASLPYFNTALPNVEVPEQVDMFTLTEQNELRDNGVALAGANRAFNTTIFGEFVTTYLTNIAGNPDTSYKFLNTVDTASVIREFFYENSRSRYAQTRLTDGDLIAGRDMANEGSIRAFYNELYDELADNALVQKGSAAKKDFNDNLSIIISISTGTATVAMAPLLVTQLRAIIGTIQINFSS